MSEDLELAAKVHYSFLPEDYEDKRIIISSTLRPLYPLGGDYCSILALDENRVLVCTCDAVGHGVSAALFAARINTFVQTHACIDTLPCDLVAGLNSHLCKRLGETGIYTSFYALLFDFEDGTLSLAGAAHPPVLQVCHGSKNCQQWPSRATYLGIMDPMPLECGVERIPLSSGQRFLLYSDGLIEAEGAGHELFGVERLVLTLTKYKNLKGQELNSAVLDRAEAFTVNGFNDDVLLISVAIV
ncbi:MAG: hypothetical protein C0618_08570 [Desulfuromonas sp.]|nr:MAG: hypothetical protein C0618_08570 [Desulfuromonas sp.]